MYSNAENIIAEITASGIERNRKSIDAMCRFELKKAAYFYIVLTNQLNKRVYVNFILIEIISFV